MGNTSLIRSQIGSLQSDIRDIKSELNRKVNSYEISSLNSKVASLEHTIGQLSTEVNGILFKLQTLEENKQ